MIFAQTKKTPTYNLPMAGCSKPVTSLRVQIVIYVIVLYISSSSPIRGQATIPGAPDFNSVGNQTQTPLPGAGHDYQSFLGETVNMATGSVSFKISFPVPKSRITIPYAWSYNSAGANHLSMVGGNQPTWNSTTPQPGVSDGWNTVGIPSASVAIWSYQPPSNGGVTIAACNVQSGMTFTGLDGVMHNLYTEATATQDTTGQQECGTQSYVPPNGDGQVVGIPDPNTAVKYLANTKSPQTGSFIVMDKSGTIYYFGGGLVPQNGGSPPQPQGIEDRNGNLPSSVVIGGTNSQQQTTLQVGDQSYTLTWTNVNVNFQIQQTNMIGSDSTTLCSAIPTNVTGSVQVLSSLTLPNHKSYSFHYDDPYGLLSEIDYPDGGKITYEWQVSPDGENEYAKYAGSQQTSCNQDGCTYASVSNGCQAMYQTPVLTSRTVSFDGSSTAESQIFSYHTAWDTPQSDGTIDGWNNKTTTVTTTDAKTGLTATTKYTYTPYLVPSQPSQSGGAGPAIPLESEIDYSDWGKSTVMKKVQKTWADQFNMTSEITTIVPTSEQGGTTYRYGTANNGVATAASSLQYLLERDDYDYSTTAVSSRNPTKKTIYSYSCCDPFPSTFNGGEFNNANLQSPLTLPPRLQRVFVEDGQNHVLAANYYQYDGASLAQVSAIQHDDGNFPYTMAIRDNLTSITRCSNPSATCTTGPTVTYTYDSTGQPHSMTDACGNGSCSDMAAGNHTATFSFADNPTQSGGNTNAYLTSVTNPLNQTRTFSYNYTTGYLTSATDENEHTTQYQYNDPLDRLTEIDYPDNGKTVNTYCDSGNAVVTYQLLSGTLSAPSPCPQPPFTGSKVTESVRDGMFHTIHSYVLSDPDGQDEVDTTYDGEGRVLTVTNPYRGSSSGITTNSYDALGRKIQVQEQDGSVQQWCYDGVSSTLPGGSAVSYCSSAQLYTAPASTWVTPPGTWVDSTDENGNHWQRSSDYFGDLLDVMEPNGSTKTPSMETDYSYDLLSNLLQVTQNGKSGDTARTRTFHYDGLSRLQNSTNPETGSITYSYDLNNNLISKTDARNITINYSYDPLNRLLGKTYSDGTLASCFQYDTVANGFLTAEWTQAGSSCPASPPAAPSYQSLRQIGAYDAMGRVVSEQQCVLGYCTSAAPPSAPPANCQSLPTANGLGYCYDLAGNPTAYSNGLTSDTFPQQYMLLSQGFDSVSRLNSVTNNTWTTGTFPSNLFTPDPSAGYTPFNALQNWTLGSGNLSVSKSYDNRLRVTGETAIQQ